MPKDYQPIEYYLEKVGNPKSYQELLEDYAIVLARLRSIEEDMTEQQAAQKMPKQ